MHLGRKRNGQSFKVMLLFIIIVVLSLPLNVLSFEIKTMEVIKKGKTIFSEGDIEEGIRMNIMTGRFERTLQRTDPSPPMRPVVVRVTFSCDNTPKKLSKIDIETYQTNNKWDEWVTDTDGIKEIVFKKCSDADLAEEQRSGKVRFIPSYDNGTVLDTRTNLMWASKDNGNSINWANAKSYCENYRGGGYTNWRMPTQDELAGLYDGAVTGKDGYNKLTNLIELSKCCPWASETRGSNAAFFDFHTGDRGWGDQSIDYAGYQALPVRSGK